MGGVALVNGGVYVNMEMGSVESIRFMFYIFCLL